MNPNDPSAKSKLLKIKMVFQGCALCGFYLGTIELSDASRTTDNVRSSGRTMQHRAWSEAGDEMVVAENLQ